MLCALFANGAAHSDSTNECPTSQVGPAAPRPRTHAVRPATPGPTHLWADTIQSLTPDVTELKGNAKATRDGEQISADYLRYDRAANHVDAAGNVTINQADGTKFATGEAHLDLDTRIGFTDAGTYRLPAQQGRGDMTRADFLDQDHTRLSDMRYTTCPLGREDWAIRASRVDLDTLEDVGVARNATLNVFGLPVFYLPYFSFPISDQRKSGFLVPQLGYGSKLGAVAATPYYWNIAPNYDATLTPRLMTERGVQLQSEFRYLGQNANGILQAEYLPNDKLTGDNRAAGTFLHRQAFNPYWSAAVDLRGVSDKSYLSDFGDHLGVTSQSYLPQNAEINYRGSTWTFAARAADYQTVDRTIDPLSRPYARLPQLVLAGNSGATSTGLQYRVDSELVNFERRAGVTGDRLHVAPAVSLPMTRVYGFVTPEIGVHHIGYSLNDAPERSPSVTAPYLSLDSGLFFEREIGLGRGLFDQTLEPRLYYLYAPLRQQDQLPNFDTSVPDFNFANLFRNNRFVGGDRVGDANQLTTALTTRLIDQQDGVERLTASVGRIHYFTDRRINIPPSTVADASSDVAGEVTAWLANNWHARASVQWTPERDHAARSTFYIQHQPAPNKILNIGYRSIRDQIGQSDISAEWPIGGSWTLRGRSLYSLRDKENVESYIGAQYNACCWAVRLYAVRRLVQAAVTTGGPTEQQGGIAIEFELTGLSRSNSAFESPLRQGLFSFAPPPARTTASP